MFGADLQKQWRDERLGVSTFRRCSRGNFLVSGRVRAWALQVGQVSIAGNEDVDVCDDRELKKVVVLLISRSGRGGRWVSRDFGDRGNTRCELPDGCLVDRRAELRAPQHFLKLSQQAR